MRRLRWVSRAVRTARALRAVVAQPPYVPPGHFYSPMTSDADVNRALSWTTDSAVHLSESSQLALAGTFGPILAAPMPGPRYVAENSMYGPADASVYRAMLRYLKPGRIIEVGSGFSTAVALDEAQHADGLAEIHITCIEPYPERLRALLTDHDKDRLTIIRRPVQDLPLDIYGQLGPGDILFIDSTHVAKAGSDVVWLLLHVLPTLAPGVVVHVHDVFWPFEYPAQWLREHRDWTEIYLLNAFLAGNREWEIVFFASWIWRLHPELIPEHLSGENPGAIWLRRVG